MLIRRRELPDVAPKDRTIGAEFVDVSETARTPVTPEAEQMMLARYSWCASLCRGRDVLEVGCGSAQGAAMLSAAARTYVAGDVSMGPLRQASPAARRRGRLVQFRADQLPFPDATFDLLLILEAIYYFPDAALVLREAKRLLRRGGTLAVVSANPARPGFIRSPHSTEYYSATGLAEVTERIGFGKAQTWGAFRIAERSSRRLDAVLETVRRGMDALGLVPRTLQGRARLKRLFFGRLRQLPADLTEHPDAVQLAVVPVAGDWSTYKVFYLTATRE